MERVEGVERSMICARLQTEDHFCAELSEDSHSTRFSVLISNRHYYSLTRQPVGNRITLTPVHLTGFLVHVQVSLLSKGSVLSSLRSLPMLFRSAGVNATPVAKRVSMMSATDVRSSRNFRDRIDKRVEG